MRHLPLALLGVFATFAVAHDDDPKLLDGPRAPRLAAGWIPGAGIGQPGSGQAGAFDSQGVDLLSWLSPGDLNITSLVNDNWGYVSPSGREYAIQCSEEATVFVEVTDPANPTVVGSIPGQFGLWRDAKVYQQYVYSVSETNGIGIEVIDVSQIDAGTVTLVNVVEGTNSGKTHNVAINEESGYLYRCGGSGHGLRIYDLTNPAAPAYVTTWDVRYVHDAQVVTWGDGRELAFCCGGFNSGYDDTGLTILDVSDKQNITVVEQLYYSDPEYSHQGWLSEDLQYFYLGDELDEDGALFTRTHVFDVGDPDNASYVGHFENGSVSIGHNMYTAGGLLFQANYRSGLRVFDVTANPTSPAEVAYFDTQPTDVADFGGTWSVYPFLPSGTILLSDRQLGLFCLRLAAPDCDDDGIPDDQEEDCNANGVPDDCEAFTDCNSNGIPDECEPDCDSDGIPDDCETDCNSNGTPDDCETFSDCNSNGVPDECEADCDSDGVPDDCEADCNANGTPDDCEAFSDCNSNGVPDECEPDCDSDGVPDDCEVDCNSNGTPDDCESFSDCDSNGVPDECDPDCDSDGVPDACETDCNANGTPDDCETFTDCNSNGVPDECEPDCDSDGVPDDCEADCNSNGTPDDCESFSDCNSNGIPDECEPDCDSDGVPDACETDCNSNGTPDDCESFSDCNSNGVPDDCDPDCDTDGVPDDCEDDVNGNGTPDDCEEIGTLYCDPAVPNSTGNPAEIAAIGSDVVATNDVTLVATQLPVDKFGYFLTSQTQGFIPNPGGSQGNLCLGGNIGRYAKDAASSGPGGAFQLTIDLLDMPTTGKTFVLAGETWNFSAWYRDTNPGSTSNFTNAVSILFL